MSNDNGWKKFEKRPRAGYLEKYAGRVVVIVSRGKSSKSIYLTDKVYEAIGNPAYVEILTRGSNAAIMASADEQTGYKVQSAKESSTRFINCKSFIHGYSLKPGTYDAHVETGKVVFDMEQHPGS